MAGEVLRQGQVIPSYVVEYQGADWCAVICPGANEMSVMPYKNLASSTGSIAPSFAVDWRVRFNLICNVGYNHCALLT
jgi:hypothetical protein